MSEIDKKAVCMMNLALADPDDVARVFISHFDYMVERYGTRWHVCSDGPRLFFCPDDEEENAERSCVAETP